MIDALYASPSWMSLGSSSEYTWCPGEMIDTCGRVPVWAASRKSSNFLTFFECFP